jgi:GNAT superfamily N-acetyltransferase
MNDTTLSLSFVRAQDHDACYLGEMNYQLIRDEGHRNQMTVERLTERMAQWLNGEYQATLFHLQGRLIGYALYRRDPEYFYLRQFFVDPKHRRKGIGKSALGWLRKNEWAGERVRVEVLIDNKRGIAFWRSVGFQDYCLTLEADR